MNKSTNSRVVTLSNRKTDYISSQFSVQTFWDKIETEEQQNHFNELLMHANTALYKVQASLIPPTPSRDSCYKISTICQLFLTQVEPYNIKIHSGTHQDLTSSNSQSFQPVRFGRDHSLLSQKKKGLRDFVWTENVAVGSCRSSYRGSCLKPQKGNAQFIGSSRGNTTEL